MKKLLLLCLLVAGCSEPEPNVENVARKLYESMQATPGYTRITEGLDWRGDWNQETEICKADWRIVAKTAIKELGGSVELNYKDPDDYITFSIQEAPESVIELNNSTRELVMTDEDGKEVFVMNTKGEIILRGQKIGQDDKIAEILTKGGSK